MRALSKLKVLNFFSCSFKRAIDFKTQLFNLFWKFKGFFGHNTCLCSLPISIVFHSYFSIFRMCFLFSHCIVKATENQPVKQIFSPEEMNVKFNNGKLLSALRKLTFNIYKLLAALNSAHLLFPLPVITYLETTVQADAAPCKAAAQK